MSTWPHARCCMTAPSPAFSPASERVSGRRSIPSTFSPLAWSRSPCTPFWKLPPTRPWPSRSTAAGGNRLLHLPPADHVQLPYLPAPAGANYVRPDLSGLSPGPAPGPLPTTGSSCSPGPSPMSMMRAFSAPSPNIRKGLCCVSPSSQRRHCAHACFSSFQASFIRFCSFFV